MLHGHEIDRKLFFFLEIENKRVKENSSTRMPKKYTVHLTRLFGRVTIKRLGNIKETLTRKKGVKYE
jgi:hypothetical protein